MPLGVQHTVIVLLLVGYGAWNIAAGIKPDAPSSRWAYLNFWRVTLKWGRPTLLERVAIAVFGGILVAAGVFVATLHVG